MNNQSEHHPYLKGFTIMAIVYWAGSGIWYALGSKSVIEALILLVISGLMSYVGIYLLQRTDGYKNWSYWLRQYPRFSQLDIAVYAYVIPGAILSIFLLAIPLVIMGGAKSGLGDISRR